MIEMHVYVTSGDTVTIALELDLITGRELLQSVLTKEEWAEFNESQRCIITLPSGNRYLLDGDPRTAHGPYGFGRAARNIYFVDRTDCPIASARHLDYMRPPYGLCAYGLCVMAMPTPQAHYAPFCDQLAAQVLLLRFNEPHFRRIACG